jgi:Tfp pilus assembly protein PilE
MDVPAMANDRGATFIELLVASVILAIAVVALMAAFGTAVSTSALDQDQGRAQSALTTAAESVLTADVPYVNCATGTTTQYRTPVDTALERVGFSSSAVSMVVTYWDGTTYGSTCYDDVLFMSASHRIQRIELRAPVQRKAEPLSVFVIKKAVA